MNDRIPGFTSTGSKRPDALFGPAHDGDVPLRMVSSSGCRVRDEAGREFVDCIMGLGAVALGYAHPSVTEAACTAVRNGVVGPLAPAAESALAESIGRLMPWMERVRFLKTGAEAMAAAVRLARTHTGRELVLGCGYHGWLDWCQFPDMPGVPKDGTMLYQALRFDDVDLCRRMIRHAGDALAAVTIEPVMHREPSAEWLVMLREETSRVGALLVVDEIKTACRIAVGGATERYRLEPDLVVIGKALANGFPLAAVGGRASVMAAAERTWISSTLATEFVSLAAAEATLEVMVRQRVPAHLGRVGGQLLDGLGGLALRYPAHIEGVVGIPEMCYLTLADDSRSGRLATECARRGLLFKRTAYNFVSLAHDERVIEFALGVLDEVFSGWG